MASAIALARAADQPLVIYWLKNRYLNCSFKRLFEPIEDVPVIDVETSPLRVPFSVDSLRYRLKVVHESADLFVGNELVEQCRADGTDLVSLVSQKKRTVVITYYRFMEGADSLSHFRPRKNILDEVERTVAGLAGDELVGVHIRGTDNVQALEGSPVASFIARMEQELDRAPDRRFFLATDDPEAERKVKERFPGLVVSRPKVFARDKAIGVRDALVDLLVLSRCGLILGSHWSSFTEVAAELGGVQVEIVGSQS